MKLVKHTIYNLIGLGVPLIVAVFSIPVLIAHLGDARFGLLTLIWAVVSYFGLFDLGLGRALTQQLSTALARGESDQLPPLVGTAIGLMAVLGIFAGVLMAAIAPWGVGLIRSVPDQQEAVRAMYAMALAMPAIVLTSGFRGILEARHAFGVINLMRLPMGLFTFLGPLAVVLYWDQRLDWIAIVLTMGRVIACVAHAVCAWHCLPKTGRRLYWKRSLLKALSISGGWLTLSNIISPFMGYVDRFVIGAIVSASAVAYYATPHELVTKLWIVPGAMTAVLFPAFAAQMGGQGEQTWLIFKKAILWLLILLFPITLLIALFANELLSHWISPEFASHSGQLLQIFALGILINCLAHIPLTLLQGAGRAKQSALIHAVELPFFLSALWWLTSTYGVTGAAIAWLLRMIADTFLMFYASTITLNKKSSDCIDVKSAGLLVLVLASFGGVLLEDLSARLIWAALAVAIATFTFMKKIQKNNRIEETLSIRWKFEV